MSYITFDNVSKVYGTGESAVKAADGVSFGIERGELCVIDGCLHFMAGKDSLTPYVDQIPHQAVSMILLGPGSFLTSLLPPLLVPELAQAIRNSQARFVFLANLAPEQGPVGQLSLADQLAWFGQNNAPLAALASA